MKPLEFRNDKVPELDISRLQVIIDDNDVKVSLLFSVFHFCCRRTKTLARSVNETFSEIMIRTNLSDSSVSVPLDLSLSSRTSRDGGFMKTRSGVRSVFLTALTPCTSMSRMQIFPLLRTSFTALLLVPYMFPLKIVPYE